MDPPAAVHTEAHLTYYTFLDMKLLLITTCAALLLGSSKTYSAPSQLGGASASKLPKSIFASVGDQERFDNGQRSVFNGASSGLIGLGGTLHGKPSGNDAITRSEGPGSTSSLGDFSNGGSNPSHNPDRSFIVKSHMNGFTSEPARSFGRNSESFGSTFGVKRDLSSSLVNSTNGADSSLDSPRKGQGSFGSNLRTPVNGSPTLAKLGARNTDNSLKNIDTSGNEGSFDSSFGVKNSQSSGFLDFSNGITSSFGSPRDPSAFGINGAFNPINTDFARGSHSSLGGNDGFFDSSFGVNNGQSGGIINTSDGSFDDIRGSGAAGSESFASPGASGAFNPVNKVFSSGSVSSFGGNRGSFDNSFRVNSGQSGGFVNPSGHFDSGFGDLRGSVGGFGTSGSGSFGNPAENSNFNPTQNGFASGPISPFGSNDNSFQSSFGVKNDQSGGVVDSLGGIAGTFRGPRDSVGGSDTFLGASGSGSFANPAEIGSNNPNNKDLSSLPGSSFGGKDRVFDSSFGVSNGQSGGFGESSNGGVGSFGKFPGSVAAPGSGSFLNPSESSSFNPIDRQFSSGAVSSFGGNVGSFDGSLGGKSGQSDGSVDPVNGLVGSFGGRRGSESAFGSSPGANGSGVSDTFSPTNNGIASGSIGPFGGNGGSFDSSFGAKNGKPEGFGGSKDGNVGSFVGFSGSVDGFGNSFGNGAFNPNNKDFANGPAGSFGINDGSFDSSFGVKGDQPGEISHSSNGNGGSFDNSFGANNGKPEGFGGSKDGNVGSFGGFSGSVDGFGNSFGGTGSGSFPNSGVNGAFNNNNKDFANGPAGSFGINDGSFDSSFGVKGDQPRDLSHSSNGFAGSFGGVRGTPGAFGNSQGTPGSFVGSFSGPGSSPGASSSFFGNSAGVFIAFVTPSGVFLAPWAVLVSPSGVVG